MSLNSLTNEEIRRRESARRTEGGLSIGGPPGEESNKVTNAIEALVEYIPTEVITLYIGAVSVSAAVQASVPILAATNIYVGFTVLTPILLLVLYLSKLAAGNKPWPSLKQLPWWKMAAAGIAFAVWALAIPGNPYVTTEVGAILAGFGALVVSLALNILEPIAQRILPKPG